MKKLSYNQTPIEIGPIVSGSFEQYLNENFPNSKKVVIVDENTHDFCLEFMITSFPELTDAEIMLIPNGEENKVLEVCYQIWEALREYEITRNDVVINLGGGVITDMGGFIASVFKRGVPFINDPTSLLAMVDASIGGKTGIDLGGYKNLLGTFTNPERIYVDSSFLSTLPEEELWNGYAEMLKHALISSRSHWSELVKVVDVEDLLNEEMIVASMEVKIGFVEKDLLEKDCRKLLNFGHTIGHAIEGYLLDKSPIGHGHAVALGLWLESFISFKRNVLSTDDFKAIEKTILEKFNMVYLDPDHFNELIQIARNDKKNNEGSIKGILIRLIGECEIDSVFEEAELVSSFNYMNGKLSLLN